MPTQQTAITGVSRRITAGQEIKAGLCRDPGPGPAARESNSASSGSTSAPAHSSNRPVSNRSRPNRLMTRAKREWDPDERLDRAPSTVRPCATSTAVTGSRWSTRRATAMRTETTASTRPATSGGRTHSSAVKFASPPGRSNRKRGTYRSSQRPYPPRFPARESVCTGGTSMNRRIRSAEPTRERVSQGVVGAGEAFSIATPAEPPGPPRGGRHRRQLKHSRAPFRCISRCRAPSDQPPEQSTQPPRTAVSPCRQVWSTA